MLAYSTHASNPRLASVKKVQVATDLARRKARELGITFVAYSPLSRGLLTGTIRTENDLDGSDWRRDVPRFQGANLAHNVALLAPLEEMATRMSTTSAAVAIAWLLSRGEDIIPLVGMGRPSSVERALEARDVHLTPDDVAVLDAAFPIGAAAGTRYPEEMMSREGNSSRSMSMSGLSLRKADKAFAKKVLVAVLLA